MWDREITGLDSIRDCRRRGTRGMPPASHAEGLSGRLQSRQFENGQQCTLWQRLIPMMWHGNRSTLGIFPDEMATACAVVPEFCIFEDAFDLFVGQGLHRETFSPSPKSMPSVTSTRYWRSSATQGKGGSVMEMTRREFAKGGLAALGYLALDGLPVFAAPLEGETPPTFFNAKIEEE